MVKLLIIADDFTGALDTGVQFTVSGAVTYVIVDSQVDYTKIESNVEVLVIDAETRHLDKVEAYQKVFSIVKQATEKGILYIYKKTDSGLRGNIGAELTAALMASGERRIHFIPAFPQMNRTTVKGVHYINGIPVSESSFGNDPFEPVRYSNIKDIISSQSDVQVHIVDTQLQESFTCEEGILVYDSICNEDIENITTELMKKDEMHLIAGCAGFANILSQSIKFNGKQPSMPKMKTNILIACGSVNPASVAQCDYSESKGAPRFRVAPEQKMNPSWIKSQEANAFVKELYDSCEKNPIVILDTNDNKDGENTASYALENGISTIQMRENIVSFMGQTLEQLIDMEVNSTIFIMGGDSLLGFIQQTGIKVISPVCEIGCGIVLSQLEYNNKTLNIISKSGGFGEETLFDDLSKILLKSNDRKDV